MKREGIARGRYEEIAQDLAGRIARGELAEGTKVLGRSSLAGQYQVSPETIRRAVAILTERGIVQPVTGSGIRVISRFAASEYLDSVRVRNTLEEGARELRHLLRQRSELDTKIESMVDRLLSHATGVFSSRHVEEVIIQPMAWAAGRSLQEIRLRSRSGATALAVTRGDMDQFSPPIDMRLQPGDIVTIVGADGARDLARALLEATEPPPDGVPADV
ncbi:MAG TPA: TrkA C-terminal domain-containing protein [Symbiobacteriaceae bacterium]|nr:TrkA C-terminal domain-containing protein [Symbiobacteriaceae bacterium]